MTSDETTDLPTIHPGTSAVRVYSDPADTLSGQLAIRPDTNPMPVITGDLEPIPYPQLDPAALDAEWHTGNTRVLPGDPYNQQVYVAEEVMAHLFLRGRPATEIARRVAVILRHDPVTMPGTPLRCRTCGGTYVGMDGPADWAIAGTEYTDCVPCALKAPRHATKAAAPVKPAAKAAANGTRRRSRPSAARTRKPPGDAT